VPNSGTPDPRQVAVTYARQILDGRVPTTVGAERMTAELLVLLSDDAEARAFAESFARALGERADHPMARSGADERIRQAAWRLILAWR
jgi:hypothetical protein